jgi:CRP/FNR family transcriptional regulator
MSTYDRRALFARCALFAGLAEAELEELAAMAVEKRAAAGAMLFQEGEACEGMHLVAEGRVKVVKISPSGRELTLAVERPPASFAEVPMFDGGPYPASAVAMEDSVVLMLRKEDFYGFCERHPRASLRVLHVVGRRLRNLIGLVEAVTFGSVRQRLARYLLEAGAGRGAAFELALTHEEIAFQLGSVREVVSRNLGRFQSEGMIRIERGVVEIADRAALEAEAGAAY